MSVVDWRTRASETERPLFRIYDDLLYVPSAKPPLMEMHSINAIQSTIRNSFGIDFECSSQRNFGKLAHEFSEIVLSFKRMIPNQNWKLKTGKFYFSIIRRHENQCIAGARREQSGARERKFVPSNLMKINNFLLSLLMSSVLGCVWLMLSTPQTPKWVMTRWAKTAAQIFCGIRWTTDTKRKTTFRS